MVKIGKGEGIGEWMPVSKFGFGRSGEAADAAGRAADRGLNAGFQVWIGRSHGRRTGQRQDQTISHEEKVPVLLFSCRRYPRFAPSLQDAFFFADIHGSTSRFSWSMVGIFPTPDSLSLRPL